jgi:hypothetical protein
MQSGPGQLDCALAKTMGAKLYTLILCLGITVGLALPAAAGDRAGAEALAYPDAPSAMLPAAALKPIAFTPAPVLERVPEKPRGTTVDRNFVLFSVLAGALSVADIELTQRCQDARTCIEMNPFMPRTRAAKYAAVTSFNAALFYWSFRRKESGKRLWWVAPLLVVGAHAVGTADNIRFAR